MAFTLTEDELRLLRQIPQKDLLDLAVALDVIPDEVINVDSLLHTILDRYFELAARERGLPFSKYDEEDLKEMPTVHRAALGRVMGWSAEVSVFLKLGEKVYKVHTSRHNNSPVASWLPTFLLPLGRLAHERS